MTVNATVMNLILAWGIFFFQLSIFISCISIYFFLAFIFIEGYINVQFPRRIEMSDIFYNWQVGFAM